MCILKSLAKKLCVYEWKLQLPPPAKENVHVWKYTKRKIAKRFYIQILTLSKKQDNLRYVVIHKKSRHFTLRNFHEIFEIEFCIHKKSMILWVTWRLYKHNYRHFERSKWSLATRPQLFLTLNYHARLGLIDNLFFIIQT